VRKMNTYECLVNYSSLIVQGAQKEMQHMEETQIKIVKCGTHYVPHINVYHVTELPQQLFFTGYCTPFCTYKLKQKTTCSVNRLHFFSNTL
jgi:hypothetical protein